MVRLEIEHVRTINNILEIVHHGIKSSVVLLTSENSDFNHKGREKEGGGVPRSDFIIIQKNILNYLTQYSLENAIVLTSNELPDVANFFSTKGLFLRKVIR